MTRVPAAAGELRSEELALRLLRRGLDRRDGRARLTVRGDSMLPALKGGEIVEVVPRPAASLRVGDLVVAESASAGLVCHRIVAKSGTGPLWLSGDSTSCVERVDCQRVVGVVRPLEGSGRPACYAPLVARAHWFALRAQASRRKAVRALGGWVDRCRRIAQWRGQVP